MAVVAATLGDFGSIRTPPLRVKAGGASGAAPRQAARLPAAVFTLAREADDLAVALSAQPGTGKLLLKATVLGSGSRGVNGLRLDVHLTATGGRSTAAARACGSGCYEASLRPPGKPELVLLTLRRQGRPQRLLRFPFPQRWPPRSAAPLVGRATGVYRRLRSLVFYERLASSSRASVRSTWRIVTPDRVAYRIDGRAEEAIIIGARRWDRERGKGWIASDLGFPIKQPTPFWGRSPSWATLIGQGRLEGHAVWIASFVDRSIPAWYTLWIERATYRPLALDMIAAGHFMHHTYAAFNRPIRIVPPR